MFQVCESSFFKYLLSFQLPSVSQLAYTARGATSTLSTSETCRSSFIFFPLPPYSFHTAGWKSSSLLLFCLTSKENVHRPLSRTGRVQHNVAVQTATRLGTVRDMALFKRGKSYLDFFAPARVFFHSFAFIQGGFTSSPSYIQSFMEVLLALHFAIIQGGFTSSPSCIQSFMEVLLALHHSIIQGGFTISPSSISDLLLRVHESGNSSRICHPLDR